MTSRTENPRRKAIWDGLCLLVSGLGTGWLIGLSVSPVIQGVITTLIALAVSLVGLMAGIRSPDGQPGLSPSEDPSDPVASQNRPKWRAATISPAPIALLIVGLALGATWGVYARTHDFLGSQGGGQTVTGADSHRDSPDLAQGPTGADPNWRTGVLFSVLSLPEYEKFRSYPKEELQTMMIGSTDIRSRP